jgi:OFA family oxalate/formate antiporter-like MFS transporter
MILFWGVIGVILSVPGQTTGVAAFTEPLIEALGISRLQLSTAYMIGTFLSAFLITPSGKLFDRIGARWMGFGSCFALGIVLFLLSHTESLSAVSALVIPEPYASLGVMTFLFFLLRLSGQGILTMSSRNMIMKWFDCHRGIASGITGAAVAFGFSFAPALFNHMIKKQGWSDTWLMLGILLSVVFAPLLLLFFRDNPEACGLVPDGKQVDATARKKPETTQQYTLAEACRTFAFWIFSVTIALQALINTAVTFNIGSIFELAHMTPEQGFSMFPPVAVIAVVINLVGGWLSDRSQLRWFLVVMLFAMMLQLIGLIFLKPGIPVLCMILGSGVANGTFGILMSITWPRYFGRKHLGAISGLCMTLMVIFSAVGPVFYSSILRFTHNYAYGSIICLLASFVLLSGAFFVRNPQNQKTDPSKL